MNDDEKNGCFWFALFVTLVFFGFCSTFIGCDATYSDGFRDGIVQKFSKKGFFIKSYEGVLIRDRMVQNDESNFMFSVDDPNIVKEIESLKPNEVVRLHYRQVAINALAYHGTGYRIVKVESLPENNKK